MYRHYNNPSKCELCASFVRLTQVEKDLLKAKLQGLDAERRGAYGICMRSNREPTFLVGEYIYKNHDDCMLYERRFYREKTGIPCPVCKQGEISTTRPTIDGKVVIVIGCSNYPNCRFAARQITLKTVCRHCGTPLMLSAGDILRCFCPKCQRSRSVPISLRIWPALMKPQGECVHFQDRMTCDRCNTSRMRRKDLLELEIPLFVEWIKNRTEKDKRPQRYISGINEDGEFEYEDDDFGTENDYVNEDELDTLEDRLGFIESYNEILDEESDGDWLSI